MSDKQDARANYGGSQSEPIDADQADVESDPDPQEVIVRFVLDLDDRTPEEAGYGHGV